MSAVAHKPAAHDRTPASPPGGTEHLVHFYADDDALCDVVAAFIGDGLTAGEPLVVVTARDRRSQLHARLQAAGFDVEAACLSDRLTWLGADETLATFMIDGTPDADAFARVIGEALARAAGASANGCVRAYGDMVDVLWRAGNKQGALRLEELWSALQLRQPFTLLCAYSMSCFLKHSSELEEICARHSRVHAKPEGGARDAELAQHREIERALRETLRELRRTEEGLTASKRRLQTIIDALPALVAYVDADRCYRFCNRAYEQWFGQTQSQLEGRNIREVLGEAAYDGVAKHVEHVLAGHAVTFETQLSYGVGGERFVQASYVPDVSVDGTVQGYIALVSDITARKELEASRDAVGRRTERLKTITAAIADAVTPEQVFVAIVDEVAAAVGASSAAVWLVRDEGRVAALARSLGYSDRARTGLLELDIEASDPLPVLDAIRTRQPVWVESQQELVERYPTLAAMVTTGRNYHVAALPIIVQGLLLGAVGLTFDDAPPIDVEQRAFLMLVARYSGQALERLRLLEAEAASRTRAEGLAERAALLSAASRAFSEAGHDLSRVLQTVVEQLTAAYADGCGIALITEGSDTLELAALHHRDREIDQGLRQLIQAAPLTRGSGLSGRVALTGEPILVPVIGHEMVQQITAHPEHHAFAEHLVPLSLAIVPLRTRGKTLGTLTVLRTGSSHPFADADLSLLQELGERAAMAIESSRLYRENEQGRMRAELLYGLTGAVISAERREGVFEAALDAIERALGTARASVLVYDAHGVMRFAGWRGLSDDYREAVEGHSPWSPDDPAPKPIIVPDVTGEPTLAAYGPLFERERIAAVGFFPLTSRQRLLGKFMVYYEQPRTLAPHEIELAQAIANHVAAAIARFSAVDDLRQTVHFNEMFTGVLGHDLRNPLAAITTAAQVAMIRNESDVLVKPLTRILNSGHRMARMIEQLLDFTRLRVGSGIPLTPEPLDVVTVVRQCMEELDDAHPECTLQLHQGGDTMGRWDADRLSQVFSNLLVNAVQHGVAEHGVTVHVDGHGSDRVRIEITNMGEVPPRLLPRLFEPMAGGQRRRDGSQGLGLGLYITREIVHAHGGEIEVQSTASTGTTISVVLPRT